MPSKKDIAWSELKVGVLIIIALAILSAIIVLVLGVESPFARRYTLYTFLPNIGGLRPDSPVMLEGVTAGTVVEYEFESGDLEKGVRIKMRILKKYQDRIRTDSIAKLRSLGLLGDKYIEITQGTPNGRVLAEGEVITGAPPLDLDEMIAKGTHTFDNLSLTVDNIKAITQGVLNGEGTVGKLMRDDALFRNLNETTRKLHEGNGTVASLLNDATLYKELRSTAANLRKISAKIETGEGAAGKLISNKEVGDSIQSSITKLEGLLARMEKGEGTLGKLSTDPALYNNLNKVTANLGPITDQIAKGQGTVGALLKDKQLYDNTNKFMSELTLLVKEVRQDPKKYLRIKFSIF
jgi:phospholipid/cholesterol/gamma-HCH transport system substrate-binding protein